MRGASKVSIQPHQMLRLAHNINVIDHPHHIWNVSSNARSKYSQHPTSPNAAPATQNQCHQRSAAHIKRHFQCTEQLKSPSNLTKYCACHEILKLKISSETPWSASANRKTIRGYPRISEDNPTIKSSSRTRRFGDLPDPILETLFYCKIQHFAFRLSPQMSRSAAPVTKSHPTTSPNTAPATQNQEHRRSASHMQRHFQCTEQLKSPSNLTKYCACHEILKLKISSETPWSASANRKTIRGYPRIIRRYPTIKSSSRTRRFGDLTRPILETILYCKIQHFALRLSPKMSRSVAPVTKSHPPTSPNTAPATQNELWTVTLLNCDCTELWLYWTVTLLNCDCTELWLYWTVTLLNCYFTELWLYCDCTELLLYWTVTLLNCDCTELWLYWTVTVLNCDCTELWLYWIVAVLNCYLTDLLLDWTVTLRIYYFTNLLLYESITLRIYYFTNLLLYESITLRIYYFTNLLLYESITLRIYYFTDLLLYESITVRIDYFTNRLLYESITLRIYYFTNLLLYESITLRIYYFTNLLLYESITLRIYYFTNLLLYESITLRIYYFEHF